GEFEDGDDVAMLQPRRGPRFAVETRPRRLVGREVRRHDLDGDVAIEHRIAGAKEHAHAAASDALEDLVAADPLGLGHGRLLAPDGWNEAATCVNTDSNRGKSATGAEQMIRSSWVPAGIEYWRTRSGPPGRGRSNWS